jgi:hypothetical protein
MVEFKNVKLAYEPLFWPFIEVKIEDLSKKEAFLFGDGCEECFSTISIIEYGKDLMNEVDVIYA